MRRPRPGLGSELLPVALILIGLAGTFGLVVSMHRRVVPTRPAARPPAVVAAAVAPPAPAPAPVEPEEPPPPVVVQPPMPMAPAEDPTEKAVGGLNAQESEQRRAGDEADLKAEALERARQAAVADSKRWRRRETLVRSQVDGLAAKARDLEAEADSVAIERDVLARELDAARAAVAKARSVNGGYAVMPNKGANGTWQRPVMIECRDGQAVLQPKGLTFSMVDLSEGLSPRSSPLVLAVGRELIRAHRTASPDGAPVIPYIYFVIRPDGIRPYYEARSRLEPLGMAFGYELVEQDWEIEFPDFDDLDSWEGSSSTRPKSTNPGGGPGSSARRGNVGRGDQPGGFAGTGDGPSQVAGAHGFVWPTGRPGGGRGHDKPGEGSGSGDGVGNGDGQADSVLSGRRTGRSATPGMGTGTAAEGGTTPGGGGVAGADGFVWPADRPGGVRGAEGMWPTRPPGAGGDGGDEFNGLGGRSGPGRAATGDAGPVPPLEFPDDKPIAHEGTGSGGGGLDFAEPGKTGRSESTPGGPGSDRGSDGQKPPSGLVPVSPGGLPGLDSPDQGGEAGGTGRKPAPVSPGRPGPRGPSGGPDSSRLTDAGVDTEGTIPMPASRSATGAGGPSGGAPNVSPPPGWVRIDPAMLAQAAAGDLPDLEKQPALPRSAKAGEGRRSESSNSGGESGQADGAGGSPQPPGGSGPGIPSLMAGQPPRTGDYRPKAASAPPWSPRMTQPIDVPLDLVVACGPGGVIIHPGGYRLSRAAMGKDGALRRDLQTIVRNHEMIDPGVRPRPRLRFLVEPGGGETYTEARRQTVLDGLPWPVSMQVAGAEAPSVFPKERF